MLRELCDEKYYKPYLQTEKHVVLGATAQVTAWEWTQLQLKPYQQ